MRKNEINFKVIFEILLLIIIFVTPSYSENTTLPIHFDIAQYSSIRADGVTVIKLPAGVYNITKKIPLPSNTIFEGKGSETILRVIPPFLSSQVITNSDFRNGNINITIRSLKILFDLPLLNGALPGILRFENVDNLQISDITMEIKSKMYAIDLSSYIRNSVIKRCRINNEGIGGGIMIRNRDPRPEHVTANIVIQNNIVESHLMDEPVAAFGWLGSTKDIRIEKNTIEANNASFGITAYGIDAPKQTGRISNVQIIDNRIRGSKYGAIGIKGGAQDIEIISNTISNPKGDGIFLHAGGANLPNVQDIKVRQNIITNTGRHGIFAAGKNIIVDKNEITDCLKSGIYMVGNISAFENVITNAKPGIIVDGKTPQVVRNNTLRNSAKILILNKDNNEISDNTMMK